MGRERVPYEGILVRLAGAAVVAVWFFLYDLAAATPFRTPALFGAVLFEGLRDTATLTIAPGIVVKYTAVHGLVFLVFGVAAAGLFALAERDRHVLIGMFMLFCCFEVAVFLAMMVPGAWLFNTLRPWTILGGNLVAALVMLGILFRHHHFSGCTGTSIAPPAPSGSGSRRSKCPKDRVSTNALIWRYRKQRRQQS